MDNTKEQFLDQLSDEIRWRYSQYRVLTIVQWAVMILVAVAGVFTAFAGQEEGAWFAQANALVTWGVITAIGAGINQLVNPGKSSERHMQVKLALKAIKGAIEFRGLPIERAEQLRVLARTNPEEAVERLNGWDGAEQPKARIDSLDRAVPG